MTDTDQNHGGIIIETNDNDDLNSGSNNNKLSSKRLLVIALFGLFLVGGGAYAAFTFVKSHLDLGGEEGEKTKNRLSYANAPDRIGKYTPPPIPTETETPENNSEEEPDEQETLSFEPPQITVQNVAVDKEVDTGSTGPTLQDRRLAASVNAYSKTESPAVQQPPESIPARQVKLLKNIDYTLVKGTKIPCTMETNIISEQDGFTSCVINQDVYSGNARVLLIEKGTKVTGEYRGSVKNGDRRLQIIWDRLITPYDVVVQLASPSTGRLGASGVTGEVDNRWMLRIGSALLVSLMSDALDIAGDKDKTASTVADSKTADTSQDLAKQILKKNIDLSPIIYIREGEMINIYVADDIDLSDVYNVQQTMF